MKTLIYTTMTFCLLLNYVAAQNNIPLNFIEYKNTYKDMDGKLSTYTHTKLWYNDTVCYQMRWLLPSGILVNKQGQPYTKQDSLDNHQLIEALTQANNNQKNTTHCINADINSDMYIVDYDVNDGTPYYYKRKPYKNYFSNVILIQDTTKIILGKPCKLAIGTFTYYASSITRKRKIWYAADIAAPFGPDYLIKNIPGLIMEIEEEEFHCLAIAMEDKVSNDLNTVFDFPATYYHSNDEYLVEYKKYFERNQKKIENSKSIQRN